MLRERLGGMRPCEEAVEWLDSLGNQFDPVAAWNACETGDWMLWLIESCGTSSLDRKLMMVQARICRLMLPDLDNSHGDIEEAVRVAEEILKEGDSPVRISRLRTAKSGVAANSRPAMAAAYNLLENVELHLAVKRPDDDVLPHGSDYIARSVARIFRLGGESKVQLAIARIVREFFPEPPAQVLDDYE